MQKVLTVNYLGDKVNAEKRYEVFEVEELQVLLDEGYKVIQAIPLDVSNLYTYSVTFILEKTERRPTT